MSQVGRAEAMGRLGGSEAAQGTGARWPVERGRSPFAGRRSSPWRGWTPRDSPPPRQRWREERRLAGAGGGGGGLGRATAGAGSPWFLADRDGRVVAAGLQAWSATDRGSPTALFSPRRGRYWDTRRGGAERRGRRRRARRRSRRPARRSPRCTRARGGIRSPMRRCRPRSGIVAIRRTGPAAPASRGSGVPPGDPAASPTISSVAGPRRIGRRPPRKWGPAYPVATGRTIAGLSRSGPQLRHRAPIRSPGPHVTIETEQRGPVEIELLGPDAPLTVANFLRLVDRRFFDGNRWHRVVPNFVVQDGDPAGRRLRRPRRRHPRRDQHATATTRQCSAWRSPARTPAPASGSSI